MTNLTPADLRMLAEREVATRYTETSGHFREGFIAGYIARAEAARLESATPSAGAEVALACGHTAKNIPAGVESAWCFQCRGHRMLSDVMISKLKDALAAERSPRGDAGGGATVAGVTSASPSAQAEAIRPSTPSPVPPPPTGAPCEHPHVTLVGGKGKCDDCGAEIKLSPLDGAPSAALTDEERKLVVEVGEMLDGAAAPSPALLPCPFCGAAAELESVQGALGPCWTAGCTEVNSVGEGLCIGYQSLTTFPTQREAIAAWNRRTPPAAGTGETWQAEVLTWAVDIFGPVAQDRGERAMRFIEEAVELAHAVGMERTLFDKIADRVYSRPAGIIEKEIGQAALTLAILAQVWGVIVDDEREKEWARIRAIPKEEWTRRHAAKTAIGITASAAQSPTPAAAAPGDKTVVMRRDDLLEIADTLQVAPQPADGARHFGTWIKAKRDPAIKLIDAALDGAPPPSSPATDGERK